MKLHVVRASNNCRRVLAVVEHLGLDVEILEPDLTSGDLKKPEYLAINANGKVPALEDGDFKLWEGNAIMQYLASKKPGNSLWPDDAQTRADIVRWQFWDACHLSKGTGGLVYERLFKPMFMKQDTDEAKVAEAEETFHTFAPVLNGQLEGRKFILGDTLTLADFSLAASFSFAEMAKVPWDRYTHIRAWYGRLDEIDAWKNTAPKF